MTTTHHLHDTALSPRTRFALDHAPADDRRGFLEAFVRGVAERAFEPYAEKLPAKLLVRLRAAVQRQLERELAGSAWFQAEAAPPPSGDTLELDFA